MNGYMGITNSLNVLSDIGMYKGDFMQIDVDLVDELNEALPLEGMTVKFKICDLHDEDIVYVEKLGENSIFHEGVSEVKLLSSDTDKLPISKYRYIIEVHYETGNRSVGKGFLTIL